MKHLTVSASMWTTWTCLVLIIYNASIDMQSMFIIIFGPVQHGYGQVHAMPCSASLQTMKMVDRCPRNSLEWDARAAMFNCSAINQTCVSTDMFLYHCVLNTYGTELIEMCAVYKFIYGRKCAEFDRKGSIVQENVYNCSNSMVPCPNVYKSTDAFKYQSCYDRVVQRKEIAKTTESTNFKSESPDKTNIIISYVLSVIIVALVISVVALTVYNFKIKKYLRYIPTMQYVS